ncbi:TPA: hypothetical protein ACGW7B_002260 [Bacillus nitratireducens]|uniref:hypothetical protein n=1 Tax=Bacillus wiedmannii TaxID=1890302 RepID=UPI000BF1238C|nr:hypothetical protein [Bacillus wiedmannii]PEI76316.1 hypothetical protein CN905_17275 [Bacillus wiedmannii]
MTNNQTKSTTLLVSVYQWTMETVETPLPKKNEGKSFFTIALPPQHEKHVAKEFIYEVQINNIGDLAVLHNRFHNKVRFKKPTDKNWYTYRAMSTRLFKKETSELKLIEINSEALDYRRIPQKNYRREKRERFFEYSWTISNIY